MNPLYVLVCNDNSDSYYHAHGAFQGKEHAVKQTALKYARRFSSREAAEGFHAELPTWLKGRFSVKKVSDYERLIHSVFAEPEYSMELFPLGLMYCFE